MEYLDFELPIKELIDQLDKTIEIGKETNSNVNDLRKEIQLKSISIQRRIHEY